MHAGLFSADMTCDQPLICTENGWRSSLESQQWSVGQKEMFPECEFSDQRMSPSLMVNIDQMKSSSGFTLIDFIWGFFLEGG